MVTSVGSTCEDSNRKKTMIGDISSKDREGTGVRVGENYQAEIPLYDHGSLSALSSLSGEPVLLWSPENPLSEEAVNEFLEYAKSTQGYNIEQALGFLHWHNYDVDTARRELPSFSPRPDEWCIEDRVIFEQAFLAHGKNFHKIRMQLPDKGYGSIIRYYYNWKKSRFNQSLMDKKARKLATRIHDSTPLSDSDYDEDDSSDSDFEPETSSRTAQSSKGGQAATSIPEPKSESLVLNCVNCNQLSRQLHQTAQGLLCGNCLLHLRKFGTMRPQPDPPTPNTLPTFNAVNPCRQRKKPPKGMNITLEVLEGVERSHMDSHLRNLDIDLMNLRRQIQSQHSVFKAIRMKLDQTPEVPSPIKETKLAIEWSEEDIAMLIQCVRHYGEDYEVMSVIIGTKTTAQCRLYCETQRRRLNLDSLLLEYEKGRAVSGC